MMNARRNWKTTLAGIGSILTALGILGAMIDAFVTKGAIPSLEQLGAVGLGFSTGFGLLMAKDGDKSGTAATAAGAPPRGCVLVRAAYAIALAALFLSVALVVLAPRFARADEPAPAPAAGVAFCFDAPATWCVRPGLAISGTAYDFVSKSVIRSVTVSGLAEVTLGPSAVARELALLTGFGFQTGDVVGLPFQVGIEARRLNVGVVYSEMLTGTRSSRTLTAGYVVRF